MRALVCALTAASLFALSTGAAGSTIHVPADQPTIQAGLNAASSGDTVLVACGTYYEHDIMMKSGVCLMSETGFPDCVTIDAQQHDLWAFVIGCVDTDEFTSIIGFTLTGGYYTPGGALWCRNSSLTLGNINLNGNHSDEGGGLHCFNSSVVLDNVTIMDNWANSAGGGLFASDASALTLTGCILAGNTADPDRDAEGGGIYTVDSAVTLTDCQVVANEGIGMYSVDSDAIVSGSTFSSNTGTGLHVWDSEGDHPLGIADCEFVENAGGGAECMGSGITVTNCLFEQNTAPWYGGLYASSYSSITVAGCAFKGNTTAGAGGGLLVDSFSSLTVTGCTFTGNTAEYGGAAAIGPWYSHAGQSDLARDDPIIERCTLVGNHAAGHGAAIVRGGFWGWGDITIANSIIASNTGGYPLAIGYDSDISCCDIWGNAGGDWVGLEHLLGVSGNICEDPLFCGDENPEEPFALRADSPCAPAGDPDCGLIGAWGVGCEATPVEEASWGSIKAMFK